MNRRTHLADFLGMSHGKWASKNGEILAKDVSGLAIDLAITSDHGISRIFLLLHIEIPTCVFHIHIILDKCARITEHLHSFTSRQLALKARNPKIMYFWVLPINYFFKKHWISLSGRLVMRIIIVSRRFSITFYAIETKLGFVRCLT